MRDNSGLTMIEVLISASFISLIALVVTEALTGMKGAQASQRTKMHMTDVADRAIRRIEMDATSAIKVFAAGAESSGYLDKLDLACSPVLAGSSLPVLTAHGYFERDPAGTVETGNMMLMGRKLDPVLLRLESPTAPAPRMRFDLQVLVLYHLTRAADGQLDLARWQSLPMASHADLANIDDPDTKYEVLQKLYAMGIRFAWDPMRSADLGLFEITDTGTLEPMLAGQKVPTDPDRCQPDLFNPRWIQVAVNGTHRHLEVPLYANPGSTGEFPAGLEVKVDGPAAGKLMMVRLVLTSSPSVRHKSVIEVSRVINCRGG